MATELDRLFEEAPPPWRYEDGWVMDATGSRVWDVADANDSPEIAQGVVRLVNGYGKLWLMLRELSNA